MEQNFKCQKKLKGDHITVKLNAELSLLRQSLVNSFIK